MNWLFPIHYVIRYILPICLPPKDLRLEGKQGFVTGWGRIYEGGPKPSKLSEVEYHVVKRQMKVHFRWTCRSSPTPSVTTCSSRRASPSTSVTTSGCVPATGREARTPVTWVSPPVSSANVCCCRETPAGLCQCRRLDRRGRPSGCWAASSPGDQTAAGSGTGRVCTPGSPATPSGYRTTPGSGTTSGANTELW